MGLPVPPPCPVPGGHSLQHLVIGLIPNLRPEVILGQHLHSPSVIPLTILKCLPPSLLPSRVGNPVPHTPEQHSSTEQYLNSLFSFYAFGGGSFNLLIFMCMCVLPTCMFMHPMLPGARGTQKRVSTRLELELQMVVNHCADAGN